MPFVSDKQRKYCWVKYNEDLKSNRKPKWDCHKFAKGEGKGKTNKFEDIIQQLQAKSLSGSEVLKIVNNKANLLTYPELTKYDDINDAFGPYGALILLYKTKQNYGHWCGLIKHGDKKIEFFDSYGTFPDDEFKWIPDHFRLVSNQVYPHLTWLLYNSGSKIEYNHSKLQDHTEDIGTKIATCGRHVANRINYRDIPLPEYVKMLTSVEGFTPDMIVTYLTCYA